MTAPGADSGEKPQNEGEQAPSSGACEALPSSRRVPNRLSGPPCPAYTGYEAPPSTPAYTGYEAPPASRRRAAHRRPPTHSSRAAAAVRGYTAPGCSQPGYGQPGLH